MRQGRVDRLKVLSIAVEMAVPPIAAAAMAPARSTIGNAEHTLDAAYGPADTRADRTTDHGAYRAGRSATFARALMAAALHPAEDALSMRQMGRRQESQRGRRCSKVQADGGFHRQRSSRSFRLHLYVLCHELR
jgi:hypothetical protein